MRVASPLDDGIFMQAGEANQASCSSGVGYVIPPAVFGPSRKISDSGLRARAYVPGLARFIFAEAHPHKTTPWYDVARGRGASS